MRAGCVALYSLDGTAAAHGQPGRQEGVLRRCAASSSGCCRWPPTWSPRRILRASSKLAGMGVFSLTIPRVRRAGEPYHIAGWSRAVPRLDEPVRDHQHPSSSPTSCCSTAQEQRRRYRADGGGEVRGVLDGKPHCSSDVATIRTRAARRRRPAGAPGRSWAEDVAAQQRLSQPGRGPGQDRAREVGLRNMSTFLGTRAGFSATAPGLLIRPDREDGLPGVKTAELSSAATPRRAILGEAGQELLPDDGRRRGGPGERGGPRRGIAMRAFELGVDYAQRGRSASRSRRTNRAVQLAGPARVGGPPDDGRPRAEGRGAA